MMRFIQSEHRGQGTLPSERLDDFVSDTNPMRVVDVFVDEPNLGNLVLKVPFQPILAGRLTIPQFCLISTYTAISTASSRADVWSEKLNATLS
jgi:hypothetical protein